MSLCQGRRVKKNGPEPSSVKDILGGVIKNLSSGERIGEEEILGVWRASVGDAARKHSRPVSFKRGILIVGVASSSWLYELTINKKELILKLEKELKEKKIKDVKFRIADIKEKR